MGAHHVFFAVEDGAHVQAGRFNAAESALDSGEGLVCSDKSVGVHLLCADAPGPHNVVSVQGGLFGDFCFSALPHQSCLADLQLKMFKHFVFRRRVLDAPGNIGLSFEWSTRAPAGCRDLREILFCNLKKFVPFAGALSGQGRVAADDESFAGEVFLGGNFREICLVKKLGLKVAGGSDFAHLP